MCTSVNEVICHGIPDKRVLLDGDIVNLDVTLYHDEYHGDLNETYYVGDKARADADSVPGRRGNARVPREAIKEVRPGTLFREFGNIIEKHAKSRNCSVIRHLRRPRHQQPIPLPAQSSRTTPRTRPSASASRA